MKLSKIEITVISLLMALPLFFYLLLLGNFFPFSFSFSFSFLSLFRSVSLSLFLFLFLLFFLCPKWTNHNFLMINFLSLPKKKKKKKKKKSGIACLSMFVNYSRSYLLPKTAKYEICIILWCVGWILSLFSAIVGAHSIDDFEVFFILFCFVLSSNLNEIYLKLGIWTIHSGRKSTKIY